MQPQDFEVHDHHKTWIVLTVVISILFVGALIFGIWAFGGKQDYKNNVDQKVSAAVSQAVQQTQATDSTKHALEDEQPLKPYKGPSQYYSVVVNYPKTWSAYVIDSTNNGGGGSGNPIDGYFQPNIVPDVDNSKNALALRVQILQQSYDQVLQSYQSMAKSGKVTIVPFVPVKVPTVTGQRIDGEIQPDKQGSMVILPLGANTLLLWTEAPQYEADFNNNILPNFSFSP